MYIGISFQIQGWAWDGTVSPKDFGSRGKNPIEAHSQRPALTKSSTKAPWCLTKFWWFINFSETSALHYFIVRGKWGVSYPGYILPISWESFLDKFSDYLHYFRWFGEVWGFRADWIALRIKRSSPEHHLRPTSFSISVPPIIDVISSSKFYFLTSHLFSQAILLSGIYFRDTQDAPKLQFDGPKELIV